MPALDKLTIEVVADTSKATKNIAKLAGTLKTLSEGSSGTAGAAESIKKAADAVAKFCEAANNTNGVATKIKKVGAALNELQNSVSGLRDTAKGIDAVAGALNRLADASDKVTGVKQTIKEIRAVGIGVARTAVAKDTVDTGKTSLEKSPVTQADVEGLAAEEPRLQGLIDTLQRGANAAGRFGTKLAALPLKVVAEGAKNASSWIWQLGKGMVSHIWGSFKNKLTGFAGSLGNLFHSIKRIAMYRGIRTLIRSITSGFSEGIKHLYRWSELVNNEFKASMDSLSTSAHYLRDSLGAMVSPLIDALAPAVEFLVEKFVSLLNIINQFFATLTGKDTWRRAVRTATEYDDGIKDAADSTKEATDAQKKLNKALQDFDELNLITTSTTKGRNPSGGNNGNDSGIDSTHFVEEPVADWIKGIKDAIERGEWYEAGNMLADKLNGLIDSFDAEEFGKNVGQKIQHGIEFYLGFMKNTHWDTLGGKLADFLNAIVKEVNPNDLGEAIVAKFNAAIDFLAGFTKKFDWEEAGKWLADVIIGAFTGLNWGTLGTLIGDLAGGLLKMIKAGFKELLNSGDKVMDSIGDFFSGLGWDGLKNVVELGLIVAGFKLLFSAVFGDAGLIAAVKAGVGDLVTKAGLTGGVVIGVSLALAWAASGIADNIEKYGVDKGLWMSLGVLSPEMQVQLGIDSSFAEKYSWVNGLEFLGNVQKAADKFKEAFASDTKNLPFFKRTLEIINAFRKLMGLSELSWDDEPSTTPTSSSTPGAQWDPVGQEWFVPEIDTTAQTAALRAVQEAAKEARKGIANLPPTDDEVTSFKGQIDKERDKLSGSKGSIKSSASSAHSGINAIKPADSDTTKFVNALKPWKKKLDGKGKNDGSLVQGADNAKSALDKVSKGTYNPVVKVTTSGYSDVVKKLNNLPSSKIYTIEFKPIIDKKTTGSLMSGSGNTANFTIALANGAENVPQGTMFVAGEVPGQAEFVGNINGKTGVASGKEITGIADAVRDTGQTEAELLREQNNLLRRLLNKTGTVTLAPSAAAGRWVNQSQAAYARATGGR